MRKAPSISIKRHYRKLSEKETEELVDAFAEIVVASVKMRGVHPANDDEANDERHEPCTIERS